MKEKPNYAELEKRVDFTALAGRLGQLTERDNPQRKTVFTLLDKVREQILSARRTRNVSYQVLAKELTSAGIPVSEPTLRKYLRAQGAEKKPRQWRAPKPNRRRRPGRTVSISTCDRQEPEARRRPVPVMPLANMPSVTPGTRLLRANESQSVRARVRFALRETTKQS